MEFRRLKPAVRSLWPSAPTRSKNFATPSSEAVPTYLITKSFRMMGKAALSGNLTNVQFARPDGSAVFGHFNCE
jgi:hypothetical protein